MLFNAVYQNLAQWIKKSQSHHFSLVGPSWEQWIFLFKQYLKTEIFAKKNHLLIFPSSEQCEDAYSVINGQFEEYEILFIPGLEVNPYSNIMTPENNLYRRFQALGHLANVSVQRPILGLASIESLMFKNPPVAFFQEESFRLAVSDIVGPFELANKLVELGYVRAASAEEVGHFAHKGEIFDLHPMVSESKGPVRIHYYDDMIEEIFAIEPSTYKTNRKHTFESLLITAAPRALVKSKYVHHLHTSIEAPSIQYRERLEKRKLILSQLRQGHLFENYPPFTPLFFDQHASLFDFFECKGNERTTVVQIMESFKTTEEISTWIEDCLQEFERSSLDVQSDMVLPSHEKLYFNDFNALIKDRPVLHIDEVERFHSLDAPAPESLPVKMEKADFFLRQHIPSASSKRELVSEGFKFIKDKFQYDGNLYFIFERPSALKEFQYLAGLTGLTEVLGQRIHFLNYPLEEGFYYENEKLLVLSERDVFSSKSPRIEKATSRAKASVDLFAEQLATLKIGDFVIHNEHGVGEYLGLQSMNIGEQSMDYLVLLYADKDKIYVPVYKMNLIQKYAEQTATLKVASLRNNKFSKAKTRARESIKKLAFDLLKLHAERESSKAFAFGPPDHHFREFELSFPFQETVDQAQAISNVLESMQKPKPMEHLVCGDVGFGKTEVAMRAAFKAVLDGKQVAILVPTTILALQHYNNFKIRFQDYAVRTEYISRFKSNRETSLILEELQSGKIDIIVGTHALLGKNVRFNDLGLVIIDEEQRFGVGHKEKLKLLKSSVDFLTLTATPIPRTLQMAFLGLKEFSLIKTPPPKRQSIKTYVVKEDDHALKNAIERELARGGQVFIVHNRVQDIEEYAQSIHQLVPEASMTIGHGQLSEKELERRISNFYKGKYQILVATTIIESGLDIPNANTMIVNQAHLYGLAQLHQLRGRIGRSDRKAYAYFVISKHKTLASVAEKRLKALQTYADMGGGFNIASCDLEIRGAGDLLGGEQSGHIETIGAELYMELLQETIRELKGEKKRFNKDIEISTPFPASIPTNYIQDSGERLKQYKRLSNCQNIEQLHTFREELGEIFGPLPLETKNLFTILEGRISIQHLGLKSIALNGTKLTLKFDKKILDNAPELSKEITRFFLERPKLYQFNPDYKVFYHHDSVFDPESFLQFCHNLAEQILPI